MRSTALLPILLLSTCSTALRCYKAIGTKDFHPSISHSIQCMGHVTSCYSLTTKEDVVGHIVEGSEFDCDNQNICAGIEGACMSQANSVRCCCTYDNCNKAKRSVVIGKKRTGITSSAKGAFTPIILFLILQ